MASKCILAITFLWLTLLSISTAEGGTLEKYQIPEQAPKLFRPAPKASPLDQQQMNTLQQAPVFKNFEAQIRNLQLDKKVELIGNFKNERENALANGDYYKARYYDNLLNIILNSLND